MWQICSNHEIEAEAIGGVYTLINHFLRDPLTGVLLRINGGTTVDGEYIGAEERVKQLAELLNRAEFGIGAEKVKPIKIVGKSA